MSMLSFWTWEHCSCVAVYAGQRALRFHQKYLNLCSEDERRSYGFGTTCGWVINDRIFIFGSTNPLKQKVQINSSWIWAFLLISIHFIACLRGLQKQVLQPLLGADGPPATDVPYLSAAPLHPLWTGRVDEAEGEGSPWLSPPARNPHADVPREGGAGGAGAGSTNSQGQRQRLCASSAFPSSRRIWRPHGGGGWRWRGWRGWRRGGGRRRWR